MSVDLYRRHRRLLRRGPLPMSIRGGVHEHGPLPDGSSRSTVRGVAYGHRVPLSLVPKLAWAARTGRAAFVELFRVNGRGGHFLSDARAGVARARVATELELVTVRWPEASA